MSETVLWTRKYNGVRYKIVELPNGSTTGIPLGWNMIPVEESASLAAVEALLDYLDKISPNMVIQASIVREAIETGEVPELVKRQAHI